MTKMIKIFRSGILAAGLAAGFVPAMPAQAAAIYSGDLDVTLKVLTTQAGVTITGDTEKLDVDASAIGDFGTYANAGLDLEPNDPTVLGAGDALTVDDVFFAGKSVNGPSLNKATSFVSGEGVITVQNTSPNNAKIVFELTYAFSGSAAIDDAAFNSVFLEVLLDISTLSESLVSESVIVELPAGGLSGSGNFGHAFQYTLSLDAGGSDAISLLATLSGGAETLATPVPEPATLPLFAAGLAALGFTARRRHARSSA